MTEGTVVIGIGNPFRRDDGIGPAVIARLRDMAPPHVALAEHDGEPAGLLEHWTGARLAVVIDALAPADEPGRVERVDLRDAHERRPASWSSSHALGLGDAVALGDALDRLPRRLVVLGVEAGDVGEGPGLSAPVAAVVEDVTRRVLAEIAGGGP